MAGIAGYGNAVGVPTLGGELGFAEHYSTNPLVNVMCLGLLRPEELVLATAGPEGTVAVLLGAATGRDGIGGASVLASASFADHSASKRPSVQVGDPFEEKKPIQACLELYERHLVIGVQDLGAAGLSRAPGASRPGRNGHGTESRPGPCARTGITGPELLMSESQERMMARDPDGSLLFPSKAAVERSLADSTAFIDGIPALFDKFGIKGYEQDFALLKTQLAGLRRVRARGRPAEGAHRLPAAGRGLRSQRASRVDTAPAVDEEAHQAFTDAEGDDRGGAAGRQGQGLDRHRLSRGDSRAEEGAAGRRGDPAALSAAARGYRDDHQPGESGDAAVAPGADPAGVARRDRGPPAPNMGPPPLLGNTGEQGEFVLPLNVPTTDGSTLKSDDFTFEAASWTLTAHEARPGHEMQFAGIVEAGVSTARVLFSFNSTNVEGWGLYAEKIVKPYLPPDGRLIPLQHRLMRAARAFLDPECRRAR